MCEMALTKLPTSEDGCAELVSWWHKGGFEPERGSGGGMEV